MQTFNCFLKNGPIFLFIFVFSTYMSQFKYYLIKASMVCLGFEPGAAEWKAQTNPVSYSGTQLSIVLKMGQSRPLFRLFSFFSNNHQNNFYNKSMWKNINPSSIRRRDSNPRPFEHESSPITTRPGLPPSTLNCF